MARCADERSYHLLGITKSNKSKEKEMQERKIAQPIEYLPEDSHKLYPRLKGETMEDHSRRIHSIDPNKTATGHYEVEQI